MVRSSCGKRWQGWISTIVYFDSLFQLYSISYNKIVPFPPTLHCSSRVVFVKPSIANKVFSALLFRLMSVNSNVYFFQLHVGLCAWVDWRQKDYLSLDNVIKKWWSNSRYRNRSHYFFARYFKSARRKRKEKSNEGEPMIYLRGTSSMLRVC